MNYALPIESRHGYVTRITQIQVTKGDDEPVFSEIATNVSIVDDAAGEYVEVKQQRGRTHEPNESILIDSHEWPTLRAAVDFMVSECRPDTTGETNER